MTDKGFRLLQIEGFSEYALPAFSDLAYAERDRVLPLLQQRSLPNWDYIDLLLFILRPNYTQLVRRYYYSNGPKLAELRSQNHLKRLDASLCGQLRRFLDRLPPIKQPAAPGDSGYVDLHPEEVERRVREKYGGISKVARGEFATDIGDYKCLQAHRTATWPPSSCTRPRHLDLFTPKELGRSLGMRPYDCLVLIWKWGIKGQEEYHVREEWPSGTVRHYYTVALRERIHAYVVEHAESMPVILNDLGKEYREHHCSEQS